MDWGKVLSGLANIVGTFSRKVHDESQKVNADNASGAGLEVRVSRTYDDVGLSGRRDCQFCLDRECTNVTLDEAYEIGAFQRHPGCGCEITYTTEKGTKVQTDWTHNEWEDVSPYERISEAAAQEGGTVTIPSFMEGNFEDCHALTISEEERRVFNNIHTETQKRGCEYGEIITSNGTIPCESISDSRVLMRTDNIDETGLKLYHGHTNDTLPSENDLFRFVIDPKVDEIGVVTRNSDVYVVTIGDGFIPEETEYWSIARNARLQADRLVLEKYDISDLTEKQIEYLVIREKNMEIIHQLGWRIEGGKL